MSPYSVEQLTGEPIIVMRIERNFVVRRDAPGAIAELKNLLDQIGQPCFYITDAREFDTDIDGIIAGTNMAARGEGAVMHHAVIRENLVVVSSTFVRMAAEGMRYASFGSVRLRVFDTLDDAIAFARAAKKVEEQSKGASKTR